jgi:hypothetical protein
MTPRGLVLRGLRHYWRTNLAVVLGIATAVAVLAGALIVGDTVRGSLRDLVTHRLGRVDHVVQSNSFFREALAQEIEADANYRSAFDAMLATADRRDRLDRAISAMAPRSAL